MYNGKYRFFRFCFFTVSSNTISMSKRDILQSLVNGSKGSEKSLSYRRFLLEDVQRKGWNAVVADLAVWLGYHKLEEVEEALIDYLANDPITMHKVKDMSH